VVHEQVGDRRISEEMHKQLEDHYRPGVERSLRRELLLGALAKQESIAVTPEEVAEQIQRLVESDPKNAARLRQHYVSEERRRSLAESLVERKALDLVIGASQVRDEPIPEPAGAA
jgi:FKBP-type peptidyl-prolyl cis-trans isomerase (trigger factor)